MRYPAAALEHGGDGSSTPSRSFGSSTRYDELRWTSLVNQLSLAPLIRFYKLHGSTNWKDTGNNADMVIMGGGKIEAIQAMPVLRRYQEIFSEYVLRGETRITIIGYGFGDDHINSVLREGIDNRAMRMFVIDPRGAGLAYDMRPFGPNQIGPAVTEFEEWFQKGLYSASAIPFRQLLWNDSVEGEVLGDFLVGR